MKPIIAHTHQSMKSAGYCQLYHYFLGLSDEVAHAHGIMEMNITVKIPRITIAVSVVVGVLTYVLGGPYDGATNRIDPVIWIGMLSLEAAVGMSVMAISPWLGSAIAEVSGVGFQKLVQAFLDNGLLDPENIPYEALANARKPNSFSRTSNTGALMAGGIKTVVMALVLVPLAIWAPARLETSILWFSLVWVLANFSSPLQLWTVILFATTKYGTELVESAKTEHSKLQRCKVCREQHRYSRDMSF